MIQDLILQVQEYDEELNKVLKVGDFFNKKDSDDLVISKLQQLQIAYELQQRHNVDASPMMLIRHGLSDGNILEAIFPSNSRNDNQLISLYTHKYMKDTSLHRAGELQAIKKSEWLKTIPLQMVLVSPLRRAIQTAFLLLDPHPQKSSLEIIVCPHIIEGIFSTNEMITEYQAQKNEYKELFSQNGMEIKYDLADMMANQAPIQGHLQLAVSQNEQSNKQYIDEFSKYDQQSLTQEDQFEIFRCLFQKNKFILEDGVSLHKRYQHTKSWLKNFFEKRQIYGQELEEKILLVAHKFSIRCLTGRAYLGDWKIDGAIDSSNCEAVPLYWKNLEIVV